MSGGRVAAEEGRCACRVYYLKTRLDVCLARLSETFSTLPSPSILGGNPAKADADGFSYWAAEPRQIFEFRSGEGDPFSRLQAVLNRYTLADDPAVNCQGPQDRTARASPTEEADSPTSRAMFCGGWIGHFSYDLGPYMERSLEPATDDLPIPLIRLCLYDRVIAHDHRSGQSWMIALEMPGDPETPLEKIAALQRYVDQSRQKPPEGPPHAEVENLHLDGIGRNMSQATYLEAVRRIKAYIRDGEVYQVNLSHRFERPFRARAVELFHWQNHYNPSGYGAYIDAGPFQIVSASPEMFITVHQGSIRTKPIKGTRPRLDASTPEASRLNDARFNDLLTSEKEQAELNMIVDLERNDVARICKPGTRHVIQPRTIATYPTVYHAVATIGGGLRSEVTLVDILQAMFPGGSITGAPKIRAMQIIRELEPCARGVYTGSIGFISLGGTVCLNIAIRTVIIAGGSAFVQVGGGVVADSDPQAEWDETLTKARALLAGIRAVEGKPTSEKANRRDCYG